MLANLQIGNQYLSSSLIIEIYSPRGKSEGGKKFCQETLIIVSSKAISRSNKVREVSPFLPLEKVKTPSIIPFKKLRLLLSVNS